MTQSGNHARHAMGTLPRLLFCTAFDSGSDEPTYGLFQDSAHSQVWGSTIGTNTVSGGNGASPTQMVYGLITAGQTSPPGSYADTVTATITF
jgi:spore coat protein U-like protein